MEKSEAEWREVLSEDQYRIMREHGTERAFTGEYYHHKEKGHYACGCCKTPLFWWDQKYDSGSGWPSFWAPYDEEHIETKVDSSLGMVRKEISCSVFFLSEVLFELEEFHDISVPWFEVNGY